MLAVVRINKIKEILKEQKSVKVSNLAKLFDVTEETIRRDLHKLVEENFLIRSYGGAFIIDGIPLTNNDHFECTNFEAKMRIAKKCKTFIKSGDTVFLDTSSTSLFIAQQLEDTNITLVTNSLKILNQLSNKKNISLIVIGGGFCSNNMSIIGRNAELNLNNYFFDTVFISCRSVNKEYGVTDSIEQQAEIRKLAMEHANKVFLIADYTKFNRTSYTRICDFDEIDYIIVDRKLSDEWRNHLKEKNVELIECGLD